jgi:hypothetical protein
MITVQHHSFTISISFYHFNFTGAEQEALARSSEGNPLLEFRGNGKRREERGGNKREER